MIKIFTSIILNPSCFYRNQMTHSYEWDCYEFTFSNRSTSANNLTDQHFKIDSFITFSLIFWSNPVFTFLIIDFP